MSHLFFSPGIIAFQIILLQNYLGLTPLMGACICGHADIAELLLDHSATIDYQDKVIYSMNKTIVDLLGIVFSYWLLRLDGQLYIMQVYLTITLQ